MSESTPTPGRSTPGTFLGREPVLWATAIRAVILALVLFGLDLTEVQIAGILVAVEAVLALLVRSQATPNASVVERSNGNVVFAGPANEVVPEGKVVRRVGEETTRPTEVHQYFPTAPTNQTYEPGGR